MSSYRPIDSKREEFRKYLERTGVMDALTKALVALYEETDKPEDALGYIQQYLGGGGGSGNSIISEESSRSLPKQMEDLKVKADGPGIKGSGDQPNITQKLEEIVKPGESNIVGGEDSVPVISKDGVDMGASGKEESGKRMGKPLPPEGVA